MKRDPARLPLAQRQQVLLMRSAALRTQLGHEAQVLHAPLSWADRVLAGWRWLRARPALPVAAGVALVVLRPRRAWKLAWRVWGAWRLWRRVQRGLLQAVPPARR